MLSLYTIFSERSCKWLIFLFNTLPWTSKLVDSSQTELQWRISLGLSFVLESYILTTLLKQTISYQPFYINLKQVPNDNVLSIPTPNSFYLLDSQILSSPIFAQILSCCFETTQLLRNYHVPIYLWEILGIYHRQKKAFLKKWNFGHIEDFLQKFFNKVPRS